MHRSGNWCSNDVTVLGELLSKSTKSWHKPSTKQNASVWWHFLGATNTARTWLKTFVGLKDGFLGAFSYTCRCSTFSLPMDPTPASLFTKTKKWALLALRFCTGLHVSCNQTQKDVRKTKLSFCQLTLTHLLWYELRYCECTVSLTRLWLQVYQLLDPAKYTKRRHNFRSWIGAPQEPKRCDKTTKKVFAGK